MNRRNYSFASVPILHLEQNMTEKLKKMFLFTKKIITSLPSQKAGCRLDTNLGLLSGKKIKKCNVLSYSQHLRKVRSAWSGFMHNIALSKN